MSGTKRSSSRLSRARIRAALALALGMAAIGSVQIASAQTPASALESEFVFEVVLDVGDQIDTGHTGIYPVSGGTFAGPAMNGTVLPGGADWITQVSGHSSQDVRITLETDDGESIYMSYTGIISRGDDGVYWRIRPVFETASEKYDWLNHAVFIGKNKQGPSDVAYDIFRIL